MEITNYVANVTRVFLISSGYFIFSCTEKLDNIACMILKTKFIYITSESIYISLCMSRFDL